MFFTFTICWLVGAFAGMNSTLFNVVQKNALDDLGLDVSVWGGTILFAFLIGWMIGGIVLGNFADRYGRVKAMAISVFLYSIGTGLTGFSASVYSFILFRFITGLGVGGAMMSISVYLGEVWRGKSRAQAVGALITSYQLGVFLSGLVCTYFSSWRYAFFTGGLPVLLCPILLISLKETKRKISQTKEIPLNLKTNLMIGSVIFAALLIPYWTECAFVPTWIQTLPDISPKSHTYAVIAHGIVAVIGCFFAGTFANRFGRLKTLITSFAFAFIISLYMLLSENFWAFSLLGGFIGIVQAVSYIYLPELFPENIRATAVGFCLNSGRLITACLVFAMGPFIYFCGGFANALILFSSFYLVGVVVCAFGLETKEATI